MNYENVPPGLALNSPRNFAPAQTPSSKLHTLGALFCPSNTPSTQVTKLNKKVSDETSKTGKFDDNMYTLGLKARILLKKKANTSSRKPQIPMTKCSLFLNSP